MRTSINVILSVHNTSPIDYDSKMSSAMQYSKVNLVKYSSNVN